ncbi:hypothetical protein [Actinoplanes friuliensis]|jgi:hypothetical protein|uniref:Lipoprotein n=1 Tax=Actinoplanes friuliensis DSM 7358 TaxID=1246995 RepID=U5W973_9ACTN|nr:hypothetical protein [Actinoplanes friuliensis]AGZ45547.1 hypothetical protein AFR_36455 [Actinoplanes friuliensis DSM 7358]
MRRSLIGVAVLALALPGCSANEPSAPSPAAPFASGPPPVTTGLGGAPPPAGSLDGKRQVFFLPRMNETDLPDSVLAVTGGGRVQVTDDYDEHSLFVPTPKGGGAPERLIKTAKLRAGGKPLCLQVDSPGSGVPAVVTAVCNPKVAAQLFTFDVTGEDGEGSTTYTVRNRDAFLQWHPLGGTGLVAEKIDGSRPETTFTLLDQGASALP